MKYISIIMVSLILIACDPIVSESSTYTGEEVGRKSCSTGPGYCVECGLNLTGGFDCYPKFKVSCTGQQDVLFHVYKIQQVHESGKISYTERKKVIKKLSRCE